MSEARLLLEDEGSTVLLRVYLISMRSRCSTTSEKGGRREASCDQHSRARACDSEQREWPVIDARHSLLYRV